MHAMKWEFEIVLQLQEVDMILIDEISIFVNKTLANFSFGHQ